MRRWGAIADRDGAWIWERAGFGAQGGRYPWPMLYTILIILAIIALLMFIFGRSRVR